MSSMNNKKSKSKSDQNASSTGLPNMKGTTSTKKNAVHKQADEADR